MKHTVTLVACLSLLAFAAEAGARVPRDEMPSPTNVTASDSSKLLLLARHGADDPAGDDRGGRGRDGKGRGGHDDGPNHASLQDSGKLLQLARHGRDDKGGDDRGGGKDDGPNHA
jgi:hypothetical protein